ncbi:hypothetical protein D915_001922 [Fasciola hepatica]|uniref:Uncharacterized protein n=1 Tax=Fasciola hepatica TaxID=6192 RepID=A0A4E0S3F7_FASHE|nr:hypothetical protein D915_001922 [Fasciola hepatica]
MNEKVISRLKLVIPEGESFIGLIVQSDRFVLTWPSSSANPELHTVRWAVNGQEKDHSHYGGSADRSELLVPDKCVHISAELIKLSDNGTKPTIFKVDYDATDGLPVDPIMSFVDSKLRVDWSAIWPCSHVKDYKLELIGKSGRTILSITTERTSHTLNSRTDCELAEMCVLARDEKGDVIGRRCVPDVPPHGNQTATFLKPGLVMPEETTQCSRNESIFGANELLKYQDGDTAIPSTVLSWKLEAHCPVVLYNIDYEPEDDKQKRTNVVMRDNECIIESILHHTVMQISLVKSNGHVVKSQKRSFFGSRETKIKICTEGGHQVRVYGPYEEEPQDEKLEHHYIWMITIGKK